MTRSQESETIRRVLNGDKNAFESLVLENQKKVYNLALKMTGSPEDAYDISQDAFIKAYKSLQNFRGDSSFGVWIYKLTSNLCIDFLRREKKRFKTPLVSINDDDEKELEISDMRFEPGVQFERKEMWQAINDGLLTLPADHRQVLILREINELSYSEIAQALNLEIGTVKSRIFRARSKLAKYLLAKGNLFENTASNNREER